MSKFTVAVDLRQYLNEQAIPCSTGTDTGEIVTCAFYTVSGKFMTESYDLNEWASSIAIGDNIINLFNHDGKIPAKTGDLLYKRVSGKFNFGGFKAKRQALENADMRELLAAYRFALDAQDAKSARILELQMERLEAKS